MATKGKLLLGFALSVVQVGDFYQIRYPQGYQSLTHILSTARCASTSSAGSPACTCAASV